MDQKKSVSMAIECPKCNSKNAKLVETIHDVKHFGNVLLTTLKCDDCEFKLNDVLCVEQSGKGKKFVARIETAKDLEIKVIKSSTAFVEVPEIGIDITPGRQSEGYYSNIEGMLDRMKQALAALQENNKAKNVEKILNLIEKAKRNEIAFTVIIKDPYGNSAFVGKNVKESELSEQEEIELKGFFERQQWKGF